MTYYLTPVQSIWFFQNFAICDCWDWLRSVFFSVTIPGSDMSVILVIDDSRVVRDLLERYLKPTVDKIVRGCDGRCATALEKISRPDVILLALVLPDIDGFDVCRQLKFHPVTTIIPSCLSPVEAILKQLLKPWTAARWKSG